MALSNVKGQERALNIIKGAMARDRMASAYLLAGEEGIGKKYAAINLAMALNCTDPGEPDDKGFRDACGLCGACRHIEGDMYPDFLLVEPLTNDILVCQIRTGSEGDRCRRENYEKKSVEELLSFHSHQGGYRIVIIDQAERMNQAAANALLKTLEEPPKKSMIILVSSRPDMLLPTIRSRCSRVNFRPLSDEGVAELIGKGSDSIEVALAMGRPGEAISQDLPGRRDRFMQMLESMLTPGSKADWKDRQDIEAWLDMALMYLRDMAAARLSAPVLMAGKGGGQSGARVREILVAYDKLRQLRSRQLFNLNKGVTWNYAGCVLGNVING